jgi:hypothetical protein
MNVLLHEQDLFCARYLFVAYRFRELILIITFTHNVAESSERTSVPQAG